MARILHIEDDAANRLLVRKILTPAGFEVIDAVDGVEGIRRAISEHPDLVLVDIAIPGLDGYEVTLRLRAEPQLRHVPIVAITAEGNRETSLAVGCDGFLQKPIDARNFVETIQGYLLGLKDKGDQTSKHLRLQSQRIVSHLEEKLEQLSSANARLLEMDQARKEFYRNVSHELATPMTPIVGYVRLLLECVAECLDQFDMVQPLARRTEAFPAPPDRLERKRRVGRVDRRRTGWHGKCAGRPGIVLRFLHERSIVATAASA